MHAPPVGGGHGLFEAQDSGPQTNWDRPNESSRAVRVSWACAIEAPNPSVSAGSAGRYRSVVTGCNPSSRDSSSTIRPVDMADAAAVFAGAWEVGGIELSVPDGKDGPDRRLRMASSLLFGRGPGVGVPNQKRFEWTVKVPTAFGVF